jgi:hypothetical protein
LTASLKILIAPLDWGLGHTTRCIPLIRYLLQEGHRVIAAAEGASARLLQENFPGIPLLPLEGYRIQYSHSRRSFTFRILLQVPKILAAIKREHKWLQQMQQQHRFDLVLSDNRYGLYQQGLPCCILTHQLQIKSGKGRLADALLRVLHYRMLNRFDACWVVDEAGNGGLSGDLAHPSVLPPKAAYIGILSQFEQMPEAAPAEGNKILVLLSGPEPMRGQLEALVLEQIRVSPQYEYVVVAGNPSGTVPQDLPQHVVYHSHLAAAALAPLIAGAALVICRSGYSTLMDLAVMGKRALLIPTPGQTEQEYLAYYLQQKKYYSAVPQHRLQLASNIPKALSATVSPVKPSDFSFKAIAVLSPLLQSIAPQLQSSSAPLPGK